MNKSDAEVDVTSAMGRSSGLKEPTGTDDDIEPAWKKNSCKKSWPVWPARRFWGP
jgi:hypothetical protein